MRKLLLTLLITFITFSFLASNADAARFGGGKSFGMTRNTSNFSRYNSAPRPMPAAAQPPGSGMSKWLGPIAGFAAGGLLASLFMGHGLGTGMMSWLLIGGVIFLLWSLFRNRLQPAPQQQATPTYYQPHPQQQQNFYSNPGSNATLQPISSFDEAAFLREAKGLFIRLQKAYDDKNMSDMREFTAPEVYAEILLQLQERGNKINQTEVVSIDTELLDHTTDAYSTTASTLFTGLIREEVGQAPVAIKEIWHLRKENNSSRWMVAGIQQNN